MSLTKISYLLVVASLVLCTSAMYSDEDSSYIPVPPSVTSAPAANGVAVRIENEHQKREEENQGLEEETHKYEEAEKAEKVRMLGIISGEIKNNRRPIPKEQLESYIRSCMDVEYGVGNRMLNPFARRWPQRPFGRTSRRNDAPMEESALALSGVGKALKEKWVGDSAQIRHL